MSAKASLAVLILVAGVGVGWLTGTSLVAKQHLSAAAADLTRLIENSCTLFRDQKVIVPDYSSGELDSFINRTRDLLGVTVEKQSLTTAINGRSNFLGGYVTAMAGGPAALFKLKLKDKSSCLVIFSAGALPGGARSMKTKGHVSLEVRAGVGYRAAIVGPASDVHKQSVFSAVRAVSVGSR